MLAFFFNNLSQLVSVFCGFQEDPRIWYFPVGNIMQLIPLHSFTAVLKEPLALPTVPAAAGLVWRPLTL